MRGITRSCGSGDMESWMTVRTTHISHWLRWYRGKVSSFHTYRQYNGMSAYPRAKNAGYGKEHRGRLGESRAE